MCLIICKQGSSQDLAHRCVAIKDLTGISKTLELVYLREINRNCLCSAKISQNLSRSKSVISFPPFQDSSIWLLLFRTNMQTKRVNNASRLSTLSQNDCWFTFLPVLIFFFL